MAGADVNKLDAQYSYPPLYWAAKDGHTECVKLLLAAPGIDLDKKDSDGWTPLRHAENKAPGECVKLMQEAGCHK